jgi:oxygen-independent coproporphyrinogen-3 oxidase
VLLRVEQVQFNFEREVERLIYLFLPECSLVFSSEPSHEDVTIKLWLKDLGNVLRARGELHVRDSTSYVHEFTKPLPDDADSVFRRRRGKQAVLHVLHDCLSDYTGEQQPWGILTGVRPMKLVHQMIEQRLDPVMIRRRLAEEYRISDSRIDLLLEIADIQLQVIPDLYQLEKEVSLYIGIPFCPTHCAYCTFPAYSMIEKYTYAHEFLGALEKELKAVGECLRQYEIPVTSVYVGGGTPTSLNAPELERLMEALYKEIPGQDRWRELNVEAGRPDTITPDRIDVLRRFKVNRISVNPQTFKAETLKTIGRGHTPDIVDRRFHLVREAGFENINMDMILGLPGEDLDDIRYTRERIEKLSPDSVTVHTMSFKRTAVVNKEREKFEIPHTEMVRRMMEETSAWARSLGYKPYYIYRQKDILGNLENVGYSLPGKEGIYNICIMEERQTIIGIGGGATTKLIGLNGKNLGQVFNPREPKAYVESIESVIARKIDALRKTFEQVQTRV